MDIATTESPTRRGQEQLMGAPSRRRATPRDPLESPRQLAWLLLQDPARLRRAEHQMLTFIRQEHAVDLAYTLAQQFVQLM
jgi:hypothetical protein